MRRRTMATVALTVALAVVPVQGALAAPGGGGVDPVSGKGGGGGATSGGSSPAAKAPSCSGGSGVSGEGGFKYWGDGTCNF